MWNNRPSSGVLQSMCHYMIKSYHKSQKPKSWPNPMPLWHKSCLKYISPSLTLSFHPYPMISQHFCWDKTRRRERKERERGIEREKEEKRREEKEEKFKKKYRERKLEDNERKNKSLGERERVRRERERSQRYEEHESNDFNKVTSRFFLILYVFHGLRRD